VSEMPPTDSASLPPPPPPSPPQPAGIPWEESNAGLGSIVPTAVGFIARPMESFSKMNLTVDLVRPIAYFVMFVLVSVAIGQVWRYLLWSQATSGIDMIPKEVMAEAPWLKVLLGRPTMLVVVGLMIIAPVLNLVTLVIWSGVVHLFLAMVGGAPKGFGATLRVICYSQTASVAVLVPVVGGLVQIVWSLVLQIIGLSQAHRVGGGKAVFAVLGPLVLCCGCVAAIGVMASFSLGNILNR